MGIIGYLKKKIVGPKTTDLSEEYRKQASMEAELEYAEKHGREDVRARYERSKESARQAKPERRVVKKQVKYVPYVPVVKTKVHSKKPKKRHVPSQQEPYHNPADMLFGGGTPTPTDLFGGGSGRSKKRRGRDPSPMNLF